MFMYYSFPIYYAFISEHNGRLNIFPWEITPAFSLPFLGCDRCNANGCSQNTLPCYGNSHKKCASLAAIAWFIMIIFTIGYLQIFKTGYFFHRSIAIFHYD